MKLIFIIVILSLAGCQGIGTCLRLEGDIEKIGLNNGAVEFCLDKKRSEEVSAPVLSSSSGEYVLISTDEIEKASAILQDPEDKQLKLQSLPRTETKLQRFLRIIRKP